MFIFLWILDGGMAKPRTIVAMVEFNGIKRGATQWLMHNECSWRFKYPDAWGRGPPLWPMAVFPVGSPGALLFHYASWSFVFCP